MQDSIKPSFYIPERSAGLKARSPGLKSGAGTKDCSLYRLRLAWVGLVC